MRYEMDYGDKRIVIVGTGHVFKKSVMEVRTTIAKERPSIVCVELDAERYRALVEGNKATFMEVVRARGFKTAFFGGLLSAIQSEVGNDYGVMPGTDMLAAIESAKKESSKIFFIDRNVNVTVGRLVQQMTIWEKIKTMAGAFLSLTPIRREVSVSQFDQSFINDILEDFKKFSPNAYNVLIEERNDYMFDRISEILAKEPGPLSMVIVIGAGHIKGIISMLEDAKDDYEREKKRLAEDDDPGKGNDHYWEVWGN
ncbi:MAG: TraB/GumN family protein [Candidatus Methanofastidiosa archaeon]|nr:TraB/GumN family protein [Candidatus Methanofastidiosa archaeon]